MYISTTIWRDLTDGHLYLEGEPFPFDGREIKPERIAELEDAHNRAGLALIQAVEDADGQSENRKQETPEGAAEGRKTARKPRKK